MPLDQAGCASKISNAMNEVTNGSFTADFAKAYNDYAKGGVVFGAVNSGGNEALIKSALESVTASPASIDILASAFAGFWATVAITGDGANGGAIVSVVNDAAAKKPLFKAAIIGSINTSESKPYYLNFIAQIETVVTGIIWTVTEDMPPDGTPKIFPETIV
jgi:hypothetical protein